MAKSRKLTVKLSYTTIAFTGSAKAGKTNFLNLLWKKKFVPYHNSTGVATSNHIISVKQAGISGSGKWIEMTHDTMLVQLKDYFLSVQMLHSPSEVIKSNIPLSILSGSLKLKTTGQCLVEGDIAQSHDSPDTPQLGKVWNMINLLDTGGQPEFISVFPAIKSSVALTFIILKLKGGVKSLNEPVLVVHSVDGEQSHDPYPLSTTNLDFIKLLMASSSVTIPPIMSSRKAENINKKKCYQCYVGTHADEASKKDIESIEKKLDDVAKKLNCDKFLWEREKKNSILFPVDNTTAGSDKEDPIAEEIRNMIHELVERQITHDVPIAWLILLLEIQKFTRERNVYFISFEDVIKISQNGGLSENDEKTKNALQFFHDMGVLLYYHSVPGMCEYVITDHQWLFDKLTSIVKITFTRSGFDKKAIEEFKYEGILQKEFIQDIKLQVTIPPKHFLQLLISLKVVALITEDKYFMPCVLPNYTSDNNILEKYGNLQCSELLVQFSDCPLPPGFFCCLVVEIFQNLPENWESPLSSKEKRHTFKDLITFHTTDTCHAVSLFDKVGYIEVQIRNKDESTFIHYRVKEILIKALINTCFHLRLKYVQLRYGFYCHCGEVREKHLAMLPKKFNSATKQIKCDKTTSKITDEQAVWYIQHQKVLFICTGCLHDMIS